MPAFEIKKKAKEIKSNYELPQLSAVPPPDKLTMAKFSAPPPKEINDTFAALYSEIYKIHGNLFTRNFLSAKNKVLSLFKDKMGTDFLIDGMVSPYAPIEVFDSKVIKDGMPLFKKKKYDLPILKRKQIIDLHKDGIFTIADLREKINSPHPPASVAALPNNVKKFVLTNVAIKVPSTKLLARSPLLPHLTNIYADIELLLKHPVTSEAFLDAYGQLIRDARGLFSVKVIKAIPVLNAYINNAPFLQDLTIKDLLENPKLYKSLNDLILNDLIAPPEDKNALLNALWFIREVYSLTKDIEHPILENAPFTIDKKKYTVDAVFDPTTKSYLVYVYKQLGGGNRKLLDMGTISPVVATKQYLVKTFGKRPHHKTFNKKKKGKTHP